MRAGSLKPEAGSGKYKAYPEYKNSGVEWLGDIPADWKMMRLKQTSSIQTGIAKGKDLSQIEDKIKVPYLRVANVQDGYLKLDDVSEIEIKTEELDRYLLQPGDVLMNEGGDNDKLGRGAVWQGQVKKCIHQNHVFAVRPEIVEPEWLNWLTQSEYAKFHFYRVAKQSTNLASISSTNIGELPMIVPPVVDRRSVINFLFHETAKIDTLIEEQQSLIRLLQEKRQAVISHAVTKGLNPDAPMKDSGVEWLGEVPEHWTVTRAKFLFEFVTSGSRGWAEYYSEEGSLFFRIANLTRDTIEPKLLSIQKVNPPSGSEGERSQIKRDDLLISITADLGSVCVANKSVSGGYVSQHVALCRPGRNVASSRWLAYFVLSDCAKEQLLGSGYGGTKIQLGLEDIREFWVVEPPKAEQVEIADFIDNQMNKYSELSKEAESQINFLQERRTALISAAVTGKIDVRHWTPTEQKQKVAV